MKRKIISIVLMTIGAICPVFAMSLKECIRQGISNNLTLDNSRIGMAKGRAQISQNRARLLPQINGVFQFTDYLKSPVNVTTGTLLGNDFPEDPTWQTIKSMQYNVTAGIRLDVPLYNKNIYAAIDVAKAVERLSVISYDKAVEELTIQIGKVYYLAQSSLEQKRLTDENISRMEALCAITEVMYENGVVLEVDLNRARINLKNLEVQRDQLTTLYAQQLNMLRFLINISPETPIEVDRMPEGIEIVDQLMICDSLPEVRMVALQKDLIESKIKAVKAGYLPTISLTGYAGGLGYQEKFKHFFHSRESYQNWFGNCFIGLNIVVPLFDANSKKMQIRQHRYESQQAENSKQLILDKMKQDYSNAVMQINHNIEVYHTQTANYLQACEVFDVTKEQYREGVSSMTAILQDEMQLRMTQSARVQAHCQVNLAQLELLRLSGTLSTLTE